MQPLPKEFEEQMKRLLGEAGFFAYLDALNLDLSMRDQLDNE